MRVQFLFFNDCPHASAARMLLSRCVAALGITATVEEREGDYPSPTILVEGRDVMDRSQTTGRCCRLDIPSEAQIVAALRRHGPGRP